MRYVLMLTLIALPAAADERRVFYGTWGTTSQCARAPIKRGGTVLAQPFKISSGWLRHGPLWCRLRWFPLQTREQGLFTGARALCGEDGVRNYVLRMDLSGDRLTLHWGPFLSNGPLSRCPVS